MVNVSQITKNLKSYITKQLDIMSQDTPMINFIKPLISRAVDKNFSKIDKALYLIADTEGNVDIENILEEMLQNVINSRPFTFNTSIIGDIEIGGGHIKLNVPLTNKKLVLDVNDLETFKKILTEK